jgi:beta-galactosidase
MLDGLGLNYNNASSIDELHTRYPDKFFFEAESSSSTSTRGYYQDPDQLNTGENYTPGRRNTSSYDNNLETWTYSGEYGLKKDRDRKWFAGQFLWTGIDYIGEPTPYDVFPVKSSFFGAVDTAGFQKDFYHLFRSQWSSEPMVHLLPMNWTNHKLGEPVSVWAYSNADTVELYLNGKSLGERKFDTKTTISGAKYLETTEATGDDKTVVTGPYPGSYTSPNGSAGKLHLTWSVPFQPGRLVAVAKRGGVEVARDEVRTAGEPHAVRLTPDRRVTPADGKSLTFVTAEVVDRAGVVVPDADDLISFRVRGGDLAGLDNGRQESAENYQASSRTAFNGKALAMVRSGQTSSLITVTARAPGLRMATTVVAAIGGRIGPVRATADPAPAPAPAPAADASYSGARDTIPAAMLDGDTSTYWSNYYLKRATGLLPPVSRAHATDWVSLPVPEGGPAGSVHVSFRTDAAHALPASIEVSYWNGHAFVPVRDAKVEWPPGQPARITFTAVRGDRLRLDLTSSAPGTSQGFLAISEATVGR